MTPPSSFQQALALHQQGRLGEAETAYRQLLQVEPEPFNLLQLLGTVCAQQQRYEEAVDYLRSAIARDASLAAAHHNLGNALQSLGRNEEAAAAYAQALVLKPDYAEACAGHGNACKALGRYEEAVLSYEQALALDPTALGSAINRGNALRSLGRDEEALAAYDSVLQQKPDSVEANYNRGNVLLTLGRHAEALAAFDQALQLRADYPEAFNNKGNTLLAMQRFEAALAAYDQALAARPDYASAWFNRGNALCKLRRQQEARQSFETALRHQSDFAEAWNGLGVVLMGLQRKGEALAAYEQALALRPDYAEALHNYGDGLMLAKRFPDAAAAYERALSLDASNKYVMGAAYDCRRHACNWETEAPGRQNILEGVQAGQAVCSPFVFLSLSDDPAAQRDCARIFTEDRYPSASEPLWQGERYGHTRIRVAYLSADFHNHATAFLMAELFEIHDRMRFEWFAYSFGPERDGDMRPRLERAFDHFEDVSHRSDLEVAQLLRANEIDIVVDLKGYTLHCRPGIFAHRPAPVAVNYLGYPGSMGAPWMDYILVDPVLVLPGEEVLYSERVVRLPDSYQVNDRKREIARHTPSRAEVGLPETAFVFCCFNNNYKITSGQFACWMRLLTAVEGSVLWLLSDNPEVEGNLRREAARCGVAPERLVFAPRLALPEHLARHRCADLFLDTLPYNAHTTASDALWAGLPVLTCTGKAFAARVAGSLLRAIELPELITASLADYEAQALLLARDSAALSNLRQKLASNRLRTPLFDSLRFARHMEAAYIHMHELSEQGLPPAAFDVTPLPATLGMPAAPAAGATDKAPGVPTPATAADKAVLIKGSAPNHQAAFAAGTALTRQGQHAAALQLLDQALEFDTGHAATHSNRAAVLMHLGRFEEAAAAAREAVRLAPEFADAWNNLGSALTKLRRHAEALPAYDQAVLLAPGGASLHNNRGMVLDQLGRHGEAALAYARVRQLEPGYRGIHSSEVFSLRKACLWSAVEQGTDLVASSEQALIAKVRAGEQVAPFVMVALSDDPELLLETARHYCALRYPPAPQPLWRGERHAHPRIRVAYLSADFHSHAVAFKTVELFELHDRDAFECFAYSFGTNKEGPMRARLERAFEHFIDVSELSDLALAQRLRADEIDIAVDLMGYTKDCRPGVFALRPTPVTVSYIGYPGSSGAPWMDYMLADSVVVPPGAEQYFSEQVVRMPHSYQVNDRKYEIAAHVPTRAELGLPAGAFVFCSFNNPYKISPQHFARWMQILTAVDDSVLWLLGDNPEVEANLRREAGQHGVAAERLVFAARCSLPEHLARLRCADLFLDTLPYNGHATASDTLWAGLPLLTCTGRSFASRVAASLLLALELPELVTHSPDDYQARALQLARNPHELSALKARLASKRLTAPLFDTPRFTRDLERAYRHMHSLSQLGLPPAAFDVGALPVEPSPAAAAGAGPAQAAAPPAEALAGPDPEQVALAARQKSAFSNGTALLREGRVAAALPLLDHAVSLNPADAAAHSNRSAALFHLARYEEAAAAGYQATRLAPGFADAWNNLGSALMKLQRPREALAAYQSSLALMPDVAATHYNCGMALEQLNRPGEAAETYARVRQLDPARAGVLSSEVFARRKACLWSQAGDGDPLDTLESRLCEQARAGEQVTPFVLMAVSHDPALLLSAARHYGAQRYPPASLPLWQGRHYGHERVRLAYLSADFHTHATAHLMAELFELHDRQRFELWAFSFGPGKSGPLRARLERAFDHFHEVSALSDQAVARLLFDNEIDIAVDLKGYTQDCRPGILGFRPAPVQVNYLGFPGTLGAPVIDYLIADSMLIPAGQEQHYSEQVVRLPDSYQVNDRQREIAASTPGRTAHGLPEQGFVFCCFNNNYKLTPTFFSIWMRLLQAVPGSVLWLLESNADAATNLRREAGQYGVDPARLVFAAKLPLAEHLARHCHADLFLDTLPCNAHTTTSDALWAGLPVLTCSGSTFAGRVAASLLQALDLGELITADLAEYEALALHLATHPPLLQALRRKLEQQRQLAPLFDTERFRRHLEAAYLTMHDRARQGLPPKGFTVVAH